MENSQQFKLKSGLAKMLKGGVIMDVINADQARIAQEAGAAAVMALERVPADIRSSGGVARMSDPRVIKEIQNAVTIPVMAKVRIGHFVESQILEHLGVDYIDESEVLTPADSKQIQKHLFQVPFVCGCKDLGEALRRVSEGAAMLRTKGEAGTGDVSQAVFHARTVRAQLDQASSLLADGYDDTAVPSRIEEYARELRVDSQLLFECAKAKSLPVVNFGAGGIATPADAALMMHLGMDGVFVGSGIFKSGDPVKRARAIVHATTNWNNPEVLATVSEDLGEAMVGINCDKVDLKMSQRGQ